MLKKIKLEHNECTTIKDALDVAMNYHQSVVDANPSNLKLRDKEEALYRKCKKLRDKFYSFQLSAWEP